jgi:hypothetical protein
MSLYENPNHTLPMPAASGMPVTYYNSTKMRLEWTLDAIYNVYRTQFRSPVFNVRPDLRSAGNSPKIGVPIWTKGARFYVQVSNLVSGSVNTTKGLRVYSQEYASINYGDIHQAQPAPVATPPATNTIPISYPGFSSMERVNAPVAVTGDFMFGTDQPDRVVVTFAPLGEEAPVRFWSVQLNFEKDVADWASDQVLYVESSFY